MEEADAPDVDPFPVMLAREAQGLGFTKSVRRLTARQELEARRNEYQKQIAKIDKAIAALDSTPNVEILLNALRDVGI